MNDHMHTDDPAVAAVLAAAAAPAEGPVPGEAQALAAFRSVYKPQRGVRMSRFSEKAKLIAAAVFGGVVVISGAATAATGSLPIGGHGHGHAHPTPAATHTPDADDDQGDDVDETTDTSTELTAPTGPDENNGQGSAVSQYVQTLPKGHRGPAVCTLASDGKCKAGQDHGQSTATTHGNAHQNTNNSLSHRQNTVHDGAQLPHGQAQLPHGSAQLPHGQAGQHGNAHSSS